MSTKNERGELYLDDATGVTVTIAVADTYVALTGFTGGTGNNRHVVEDDTNDQLQLGKGTWLVMYRASVDVAASKRIESAILKNGVTGEEAASVCRILSDAEAETMVGWAIVSSDGDDIFTLGFKNVTDTTNVVVHQASLTAIALDTHPPRLGTP